MRNAVRTFAAVTLAVAASFAAGQTGLSAPKKPAPAPSASGSASPAALPTATPEPPDIAVPRLEAKLKANPDDKDSMTQLAGYYLGLNRTQQALGLTQRLLTLGPKSAQVYYLDGIANQALGRIPAATQDFEQASNLEPTNAQILLTLTNLYLGTNRAADAERIAKRATTFNATDKRVFLNYGLVLGQEGKFDEARAQFENAAKLDPKDAGPIVLEARAYVSQKAPALAAQEFDRALTVDPKSADALFGKAGLQVQNHDIKGAIATYETLLAAEPTDDAKGAVLVQEYQAYRDEKMNDQAVAVLKRAEQQYPKVAAVHLAYGDYDAGIAKDVSGAEAEWKTALGPNRENPEALGRLGQLALSQNKRSDAVGYFKRLTEVVPADPTAWGTLGQVYGATGDFTNARGAFRHSFELARTPQALAGLGTTDLQLRNYKECSQIFSAIDRNAGPFMKQNPQLLYVYGKCAQSNNDKVTARNAYTRFRAYLKPGSPLALQVDKTLKSLGSTTASKTKPAAKASPKAH